LSNNYEDSIDVEKGLNQQNTNPTHKIGGDELQEEEGAMET